MASGEPHGSKDGSDATSSLPRGLLGKSGAPVSKSTRLPTVRAARDLTLGGAQRKLFKPTIPVRSKDNSLVGPIEDKLETKERKPRRERTDKSPRGRSKTQSSSKATTIQSQSIFEQGPTERTIKRESIYRESGGGGGGGSGGGSGSHSSTSVTVKNMKQTKKETQEILDQLLRDDFLDDGDEIDVTNQPVVLPLLDTGKVEKRKGRTQVKPEPSDIGSVQSDPTLSAQVIDHNDESLKLVLVQLPDCMPGLIADDNDRPQNLQPKVEPTSQQQHASTNDADISERLKSQCTLRDLSDGKIGKIQITKSGKARLVLGNVVFDLNKGASCSFLQELVCVDTQTDNGKVSCLGAVKDKLVVVPNIDSLLK